MRNFWIKGQVDGRNSNITGGPRNKEGGMNVSLYQRVQGESVEVVEIESIADGIELVTFVTLKGLTEGAFIEEIVPGKFKIISPR